MHVSFIDSITAVDRDEWNSITGVDYPFTRHEFLHALETTGATTLDSGWQPNHLLVHDNQQLVAVMPLYLKYHSYGEYVFDWSWADAYRRHGLAYYPKLLCAIPFTPATGPRLCFKTGEDKDSIIPFIVESILDYCQQHQLSSFHLLFPEKALSQQLKQFNLPVREGVQFHWFNQQFKNFDEFLNTFSSRKRKNLKKERRCVDGQGIQLTIVEGTDIDQNLWRRFYYFYQLTYAKRSGHGGYLEQSFFEQLADTMPEHLVLVLAYEPDNDQPIAGALNFKDSQTLYGRYWGCLKEFDFLHFEACYYQGIEYCIKKGLQRFDPGAQGEHKIQRGFTPITTRSNHWIAHTSFRNAIDDFLRQDNAATTYYLQQTTESLPFKK